jgi:hypothetical protein
MKIEKVNSKGVVNCLICDVDNNLYTIQLDNELVGITVCIKHLTQLGEKIQRIVELQPKDGVEVVKRPRGRPRKNPLIAPLTTTIPPSTITSSEGVVKRGRGRPHKNPIVASVPINKPVMPVVSSERVEEGDIEGKIVETFLNKLERKETIKDIWTKVKEKSIEECQR